MVDPGIGWNWLFSDPHGISKAKIYLLTENALEEVDYTATEHFSLTRTFLNDHRAMLRRLLGEDVV